MLGQNTIGRTSHVWLYLPRYKIIILQDARALSVALRLLNYLLEASCSSRGQCAMQLHSIPRSVKDSMSALHMAFEPHGPSPAVMLHNYNRPFNFKTLARPQAEQLPS